MDEEEKKKQAAALPAARLQPNAALGEAAPATHKPLTTADVLDKTSPSVGAVWRGTSEDVGAAASKGEYGRAVGLGIRGGLGLFPAAVADVAAPPAISATQGVRGFIGGLMGEAAESAPAAAAPAPPAMPGSFAAASYSNEGRNYPAPATGLPSSVATSPSAVPQPMAAKPVELGQGRDVGFGVKRFDAPGQSPLFTNMTDATGMADNQKLMGRGAITPQNQAALDAMDQRMSAERAGQRSQQQFAAEAAQAQAIRSANMQGSINSAEMKLGVPLGKARRAQMLAESQVQAQLGASARDQQRLGLDRQRLGMDAARVSDDMQGSAIRRESAGLELQQAKQRADLQAKYMAATDPAEKARHAQTLRELDGKTSQADWGIQVTPATKNVDGTTTPGSVYRFNKATGQVERVDSEPQAAKPAGTGQKYEVGQTIVRGDGAKARVLAVDESGKPTQFQPL